MNCSRVGPSDICKSLVRRPRAIPQEVRALAPDVPWQKIIGMRNVLVHGYFAIDTDIVWDAATRDIPALKPSIEQLLATLDKKS